ncbi:MAG: hypothetical protein O2826_05240 [Chloroflexi bacterium]|nr:hypothetical protein [Chloroflexota bacterium]MDA1173909.1 hypothetical protein [Chloroflexota bacterium]
MEMLGGAIAVVAMIAVVAAAGLFEARRKSITSPTRKEERETSEWEVILEIELNDSARGTGEQIFVHQAGDRITDAGHRCSVKLEDLTHPGLPLWPMRFKKQRMRVHPHDVAASQEIIQALRDEWNGVILPEQDLRSAVVTPPRDES